jgi:hypothetical protein
MLTAVIFAEGDPENLAATLGALVPAVIEGLLGDAVVVARVADPAVATVAEIAGASLAVAAADADAWREGARLARRDWLLCLRAGDVPADGWMRAVDQFLVAAVRGHRPLGRFSRPGLGLADSLSLVVERMAGTRVVRAGDLVQRSWLGARNGARVRPLPIAARIARAPAS